MNHTDLNRSHDPMFVQRAANRALLKYAAGANIFCPLCGHILDAKRTVNVTHKDVSKTCCTECWDCNLKPLLAARPNNLLARVDVLDGRVVFKRVK